jgi:hypothetical protein
MPGFDSLPAGSRVACAYNWTAKAIEANYTYNVLGVGFQTGGGERAEGGTSPFIMVVPADNTRDDEGCA